MKTLYVCQNCAFQSSKWQGKCPECEAWNSFSEEVVNVGKPEAASKGSRVVRAMAAQKPQSFSSVSAGAPRTPTGIHELDQVLGGGIVEGSLVLLSGEPGIGKSTLTLQVVGKMADKKKSVLLITGEESVDQVSDRAKRLGLTQKNIQLLYETSLENLLLTIENEKPEFLVVDSVQVMASEGSASMAGTLTQVRTVTEAIMSVIKRMRIPTLLIGHVNKDGNIAGPKVLEHLVDAVLLLEGERDQEFRMLRALKNRYGTVSEVGLFEMQSSGLQEIKNPAERILKSRPSGSHGTCLTMTLEGNRPLLMEVQALATTTPFGYPKRAASGFDRNRLELLLAVLQKHSGLNFADQDVYVNVVGGLHLSDPGADLAICAALASSLLKKPLEETLVAFGEVGLSGEIRPAFRSEERKKNVKKLGLKPVEAAVSLRQTLGILTK